MKLVKNLVLAGLLVFTISINTLAEGGEQQIPNIYTPPPTPTPEHVLAYEEGTSAYYPYTGEITTETSDYLLFEMLAALLSVY